MCMKTAQSVSGPVPSSNVVLECARKDRVAKLWKERGWAFLPVGADGLLQKLDYIHANPVRAQLVETAEEWEFSSARWYAETKGPLMMDTLEG